MPASQLLSRLRRPGRLPAAVPVRAVRAGLFALLAMTVGTITHHLAFDSSPAVEVRLLATVTLFGLALPGAGQARSLRGQLALAFAAQASLGYLFLLADGVVAPHAAEVSAAHVSWPVAVTAYAVLPLLGAFVLHGVDSARRRVLCAAAQELGVLRRWVARLLCPVLVLRGVPDSAAAWRLTPEPARIPASMLLADHVLRRGPPVFPLPHPAA